MKIITFIKRHRYIVLGILVMAIVGLTAIIYAYQNNSQTPVDQSSKPIDSPRQTPADQQVIPPARSDDSESSNPASENPSPSIADTTPGKKKDSATSTPTSPTQPGTPSTPPTPPSTPSTPPTPPSTPSNPPTPPNPPIIATGCLTSVGYGPDLLDPWGGCWPGSRTTGVPSGVTLTNYTDSCTINTPGTVIDSKILNCSLSIYADNVTLKRSKIIMPANSLYAVRIYSGNILIEDTEIDGNRQQGTVVSSGGAAINGDNYTLRRVNIHHVYEGPRIGSNVTIEDSYIHRLLRCQLQSGGSCHVDTLQTTGGSNITVRHNTLFSYNPDVSDIFNSSYIVKADLGNINNVLIEKNYMSGGNYTLYVRDAAYLTRGVTVRNNYFGADYRYGTRSVDSSTGTIWENNRSSADNSLISL